MQDKYDLVVVGTSFASTFFLKKYLEKATSNTRILVLERGFLFEHKDRLKAKTSNVKLSIEKAGKTYTTDSSKIWVFDPNFGGSSNCWTACTPRFMPNDFQLKSNYGVGQDWPLNYDDISDYYDQVEHIMDIAGPEITPFPKKAAYPLPPHQLSSVDRLLNKKYKEKYISQPTARASMNLPQRGMCCTSAVCDLCPVNAKFTIENSLMSIYEDERITLSYGSQVIGLKTTQKAATAITYLKDGTEYTTEGESFALGANAVFNAHILLNSGDDNKNTGAGICEQVGRFARFYYDGLNNLGGSSIITANGYMMYDGEHRKDYAAAIIESFNTPFIRNEKGKYRMMSLFKFVFEDLPQNENRVVLTDDVTKPKIIYKGHSAYAEKGLAKLSSNIENYFSFLPIEKIELDDYNQKTEFHLCSTTKMGSNKQNSVIDKELRHHKWRNVICLGSSTFPSITPANPTLTLSALSIYAAERYMS